MSRGPGRLERAIVALIEKRRGRVSLILRWQDIADEVYPASKNAHDAQVTCLRAMHSFVRKNPRYALIGGKGTTPLYLYEPGNRFSTAKAKWHTQRQFARDT